MMILKFIQDSASTTDNERYSFIFKISIKLISEVSKVQYVVVAVPARTDVKHRIFTIIDHEGRLWLMRIRL